MASICELAKNALWHAFSALDNEKSDCVPKSRLLVFSASLGNLLGVSNVEKGLQEYRSTPYLKFQEFMFYLEKELFTSLCKELSIQNRKKIHDDINDICWLICKNIYFFGEESECPEEYYFKLFRIFCVLGECLIVEGCSEVILSVCEVEYISSMYNKILGAELEVASLRPTSGDFAGCYLSDFFIFMKKHYLNKYEKTAILEATDEVFDILVENVIKKGYLKKTVAAVGPSLKMWFVLKQHSLTWYINKGKKDIWDEINFYSSEVKVENGPGTQFFLVMGSKSICLGAADHATKLQWMAAVNVALMHSKTLEPFQQMCSVKRRQLRKEVEAKIEEEKRLLLQKEEALELQRKAKIDLELQLQKETEKLKDLEIKERVLLLQLEEERQAKRDEEVVRNLQSRMLAEEWEKREALETQQQQKEAELYEERRKREQLEDWQKKRQGEIEQLENVVSSLEKEKEHLHGTLKRTKILLREPKKEVSDIPSYKNLKRSISADFSLVSSEKWSIPSNTDAERY